MGFTGLRTAGSRQPSEQESEETPTQGVRPPCKRVSAAFRNKDVHLHFLFMEKSGQLSGKGRWQPLLEEVLPADPEEKFWKGIASVTVPPDEESIVQLI